MTATKRTKKLLTKNLANSHWCASTVHKRESESSTYCKIAVTASKKKTPSSSRHTLKKTPVPVGHYILKGKRKVRHQNKKTIMPCPYVVSKPLNSLLTLTCQLSLRSSLQSRIKPSRRPPMASKTTEATNQPSHPSLPNVPYLTALAK